MKNGNILLYTFLIITALAACQRKNFDGYAVEGKTKNIEDGTLLYLDDQITGKRLDSTLISGNKFKLSGKLIDTTLALLRTSDFENYAFLYIGNEKMTFDASHKDFRHAELTGSKSHDFANKHLFSKLDSIEHNEPDIEKSMPKMRELNLEFVAKYPNHNLSSFLLESHSSDLDIPYARKKSLFEKLSTKNKNSFLGKKTLANLETFNNLDTSRINPKISELYIDFYMQDTSMLEQKLSDHLGKLTLLEFWASNCGPCLSELPIIKSEYEEYKSYGFNVVGISLDTKEISWKKAINRYNLTWTNLSDLKGNLNIAAIQYGVNGIPDNFLIDSNGVIVARDLRGKELNQAIKKYLLK